MLHNFTFSQKKDHDKALDSFINTYATVYINIYR